jgi:hypothetical protein
VLLFAELGTTPFSDSIVSVDMGGSKKYVLPSERRRSFMFASAISMSKPAIVALHDIEETGRVETHLHAGIIGQKGWRRLVHLDGEEGEASLSPDGQHFVFSLASKDKPDRPHLWLAAMDEGAPVPILNATDATTWENSPSWAANGQDLFFIQHTVSINGPESVLFKIEITSKTLTSVLTLKETVVAVACLKEAGSFALLSRAGLELMHLGDARRKVLFPWTELSEYRYAGGGLTAAQFDSVVAVALFNVKKKRYELVLFNYEKQSKRSIYSTPNRVLGLTFVGSA